MNIDKPYFPFCLSNGLDSILVDYSGSMHCDSGHLHLEQHQDAKCAWEKITHRNSNRRISPILQCPYRLTTHNRELYEIRNFRQSFAPFQGILTTYVQSAINSMQITTFITEDHLYVEHYRIIHVTPKVKPMITFLARKPKHTNVDSLLHIDRKRNMDVDRKSTLISGSYSLNEIQGSVCIGVTASNKQSIIIETIKHGKIQVGPLKKGDEVVRLITLQDSTHEKHHKSNTINLINSSINEGYEKIKARHVKGWCAFQNSTKVSLPDKTIQQIYRTSLWLIRASQKKDSGFISEGTYDLLWGGGIEYTWDMIYSMRALLTSNQMEAAKKLLDNYQYNFLPQAQLYAKQLRRNGAYFPHSANCYGKNINFPTDNANDRRDIQKWNCACIAIQLFDIYRFCGDKSELKKRLPVIKEILDFLIPEIVDTKCGKYYIKRIQGADENIPRDNDTAHIISLLQALKDYNEACKTIEIPINLQYEKLENNLTEILSQNMHDGILLPFLGSFSKNLTSFHLSILAHPEGINTKTLNAILKNCTTPWGVNRNGKYGSYCNRIWPWSECEAAIAFSNAKPKLSFERLQNAIKYTSTLGIFPEKIRPDGFWINFGYTTTHASFVYAVNSLLASDNSKTLYVAHGIPDSWGSLSFKNIHTASGFRICFSMKNKIIRSLIIENLRDTDRSIRLRVLNKDFGKQEICLRIKLSVGINRIV